MQELTTIQLTSEEAKLFTQFQKRFAFMQLMESLGIFEIRSGKVEIHFSVKGEIVGIDIHRSYKLPI